MGVRAELLLCFFVCVGVNESTVSTVSNQIRFLRSSTDASSASKTRPSSRFGLTFLDADGAHTFDSPEINETQMRCEQN